MNDAPTLVVQDDIGICKPVGQVPLSQAVAMVTTAIGEARRLELRGLMFVATNLGGFAPPSIGARHAIVREWANAARGQLRVAIVISAAFFDPEAFAITVARNFGLDAGRFTREDEAMAWLREAPP